MDLKDFCSRFQRLLKGQPGLPKMDEGSALLSDFVSDAAWIGEYLRRIILDSDAEGLQRNGIWSNEIQLYRSPDKAFVVMAYIWDAYVSDPIHDHGSWGLIGTASGVIRETKYGRIDDGAIEGFARLVESGTFCMRPGDTTLVGPVNEGIHRIENLTEEAAISIGVYGRSLRKGYVQFYDPGRNSVRRVYAPPNYKKVLAIRALGGLSEAWSSDLKTAVDGDMAEFLKEEYGHMLKQPGSGEGCLPASS